MTDLEIFDKWHKSTIAKYSITENWQVGALIEFAKMYHKEQLLIQRVSSSEAKLKFNEFASKQQDLDNEFVKIVNDNFWDLL